MFICWWKLNSYDDGKGSILGWKKTERKLNSFLCEQINNWLHTEIACVKNVFFLLLCCINRQISSQRYMLFIRYCLFACQDPVCFLQLSLFACLRTNIEHREIFGTASLDTVKFHQRTTKLLIHFNYLYCLSHSFRTKLESFLLFELWCFYRNFKFAQWTKRDIYCLKVLD